MIGNFFAADRKTGGRMIWLNGDMRPAENAVSANDRGLLLGEAVFETMLVENRHIAFWDAHLARLMAACAAFGFDCRYSDTAGQRRPMADRRAR